MNLIVYTVITGNYDNLRAPTVIADGVRYICFSDRPRQVPPWEMQGFPQVFGTDVRRNSRIPKILAHLVLPETECSIYIDGAFLLKADPRPMVPEMLGGADVALFTHPFSKSFHDERAHYEKIASAVPADIEAEYRAFVAENVKVTGQFWAGGFIIRRHNERTAEFNELWMRKYLQGSRNDQFSMYHAAINSGAKIASIPGYWSAGGRLLHCFHATSIRYDNPVHKQENATWAERTERIKEICRC